MNFVMDCSFSSTLFLPDENSDSVRSFFLKLDKGALLYVPVLWWYETTNVLNMSIKRKRISHTATAQIIQLLNSLNLETDSAHGSSYARELLDLSHLYGITSYDAGYLELAIRKQARLLSCDNDLINTAEKCGIKTS